MVQITASYIDQLKILPRLAFLCQIILTWKVCIWFMDLPDPTTQQSAFVSLVTAMLSASLLCGWVKRQKPMRRRGMIGQIISSVAGLATTYIDSKAKIKAAEAETKMKLATGEINWEQAAIEASKDSWKDEAWTICFIIIVAGNFIPGIQPFMAQGFENMAQAPASVSVGSLRQHGSSFSIRTMRGLENNGNVAMDNVF